MPRESRVARREWCAASWQQRLTSHVSRLASTLRRLAGMPDYAVYVAHARRCHPDRPVLSERDHFTEYLRARYADGPTRCC